jgi:hypothetical protein
MGIPYGAPSTVGAYVIGALIGAAIGREVSIGALAIAGVAL